MAERYAHGEAATNVVSWWPAGGGIPGGVNDKVLYIVAATDVPGWVDSGTASGHYSLKGDDASKSVFWKLHGT